MMHETLKDIQKLTIDFLINLNAISFFLRTIEKSLKVSCDKRNQIRILERFLKMMMNIYWKW